jgi:hypothetical protein
MTTGLEEFAADRTCWRASPWEVGEWWRRRAATNAVSGEREQKLAGLPGEVAGERGGPRRAHRPGRDGRPV